MMLQDPARQRRRSLRRAVLHFRSGRYRTAVEYLALAMLGSERLESLVFRARLGYPLDLREPRTFSQKVVWRKLYQDIPFAPMLADKLAVRDFVSDRAGSRYLNELIGVYDHVEDIDFARLPHAFIARCTHGSKFNVIVRDKASTNLDSVRRQLARYLAISDFAWPKNEWWYSQITPRIIIERLLTDAEYETPTDYQVHVFDGKAAFFLLISDRFRSRRLRYYKRDWQPLDLYHGPLAPLRPPPRHLDEMLAVAEALARDLDFARVDLFYPHDEAVIFSEITLAPASGRLRFNLQTTDDWIGTLWDLRPRLVLSEAT